MPDHSRTGSYASSLHNHKAKLEALQWTVLPELFGYNESVNYKRYSHLDIK
jgi:hypothetical protein